MHKLDEFIEQELIPQYTRGTRRKDNPEYKRIQRQLAAARQRGDRAAARDLGKQLRSAPLYRPDGPRLPPAAIFQVCGRSPPGVHRAESRSRADQGQAGARSCGMTLGLELNQDKTLITHARTGAARFLGYEITVQHCDTKITSGRRRSTGRSRCGCPPDVIKAKCAPYRQHGKPVAPAPAAEPRRLRHRQHLRRRIPGHRRATTCSPSDVWRLNTARTGTPRRPC